MRERVARYGVYYHLGLLVRPDVRITQVEAATAPVVLAPRCPKWVAQSPLSFALAFRQHTLVLPEARPVTSSTTFLHFFCAAPPGVLQAWLARRLSNLLEYQVRYGEAELVAMRLELDLSEWELLLAL